MRYLTLNNIATSAKSPTVWYSAFAETTPSRGALWAWLRQRRARPAAVPDSTEFRGQRVGLETAHEGQTTAVPGLKAGCLRTLRKGGVRKADGTGPPGDLCGDP